MLSYELYEMVLRYIEASITVRELEDWLVPREPDILRNPDSVDSIVVGAFHSGLAEMSDGLRDEVELRNFLREVIDEYPVRWEIVHSIEPISNDSDPGDVIVSTGTSIELPIVSSSEFTRVAAC